MPNPQKHIDEALAEADAAAEKEAKEGKTTEELKAEQEKAEAETKAGAEKLEAEKKEEEGTELTEEQKEEAKKKEEELKAEEEKKVAEEKAKLEGKKEGKEIADTEAKEASTQNWWETPEKKKEEPTVETDKDIQAKVIEYDKLISDPEIKAFVEAKKAGKTLRSFVGELKGVDPESLSPEQLHEIKLKKYNLTAEEHKEQVEKFEDLTKIEQVTATQAVKDELLKEQDERLSKFSTEATEASKKEDERNDFITNKAKTDLDNYIKDIEGKDFLGVKITPEIAEGLKAFADKDFTIYNPDGTFNVPYMVELGLFSKYRKQLMTENIERATEKGKKEILDGTTRPSQENKGTQRLPDLGKAAEEDVRAAEDQAKKANPIYTNSLPIPTN